MGNSQTAFNPHNVLFREGEDASKLFMISAGEVLCLKNMKGKLIPVFKAGEGDVIGESAMIDGAPYTYSAISLTNVEALSLDASDLHEIMKLSPGWLYNLTSTLVTRFNNTANLIAGNRIMHKSIISEDQFTPEREMDYKKLLGQ